MLAGPLPEGSPAESPAGEGGTALPPAAAAAGPGQVEGAPSGLPQEEGEAGSNSPVWWNCSGQETTSQEGRGPSWRTQSSQYGCWAAWGPAGTRLQEPFWDGWGKASFGSGLPG